MSETYTPPTQSSEDEAVDDNFVEIEQWQAKDAARLAREMTEGTTTPAASGNKTKRPWTATEKVSAGVVVAAALAGTGYGIDHTLPGVEIASATSTVFPGEGLEQSVDRAIEEIESRAIDPADTTERNDVISQAVGLYAKNGIVQPGQNVTVIAEKSPIFGDVTYKATTTDADKE